MCCTNAVPTLDSWRGLQVGYIKYCTGVHFTFLQSSLHWIGWLMVLRAQYIISELSNLFYRYALLFLMHTPCRKDTQKEVYTRKEQWSETSPLLEMINMGSHKVDGVPMYTCLYHKTTLCNRAHWVCMHTLGPAMEFSHRKWHSSSKGNKDTSCELISLLHTQPPQPSPASSEMPPVKCLPVTVCICSSQTATQSKEVV